MKEVFIFLSINGGESEEFTFKLDDSLYERLEGVYKECSKDKNFDNDKFWGWLKTSDEDLAKTIESAIKEELSHYCFEDDLFNDMVEDFVGYDQSFPLCNLHFNYLTAEGKITDRHLDCAKAVIYGDNIFDCDFSEAFREKIG